MITFFEDEDSGYRNRTEVNVKEADITIAFAVDYTTSGEYLTKNFTLKHSKPYYAFPLRSDNFEKNVQEVLSIIKDNNCRKINVAGNGIFTLTKYGISQEECDDYIFHALKAIVQDTNIEVIRSGGQTGADESGLKAALKLKIEGISYCPKGWKIRTATETICDENFYKLRFL